MERGRTHWFHSNGAQHHHSDCAHEHGAVWREAEWGGMRVGFGTDPRDFDDALLPMELPNDRCQCPHWGSLLSGRMVVRYEDREEAVEAGDVYYTAPGHAIAVDAGTVLVEFSPKETFQETVAVGERNLAKVEHSP